MGKAAQIGFTLIEILVVICIVGVLSLVIFPYYTHQQEKSVATELADNFRTYASTFSNYAKTNGTWPIRTTDGILPDTIKDDIPKFSQVSIVGGHWDWSSNVDNNQIKIRLIKPHADIAVLERVDFLLDDGNLSTGLLTGNEDHLTLLMLHEN